MTHETTIQHRYTLGNLVYMFNKRGVIGKGKVTGCQFYLTGRSEGRTLYKIYSAKEGFDETYAEDEVYETIDEVLQAQREILERSE